MSKPNVVPATDYTYEDALRAWQEAREAAERAKQKKDKAEAAYQKAKDAQRDAWVRLKDAQWAEGRGKDNKLLATYRAVVTDLG